MEKKAATAVPKPVKRRRRSKVVSLNAEIRQSAKQIYESGMAEAMKAAALLIVARKMDEVRGLLQAAGINPHTVGGMVVSSAAYQAPSAPQPARQPEGPTCFSCGRPAVRKSRPNQFNPTGSWVCQIHVPLIAKDEAGDEVDRRFNLNTAPLPKPQIAAAPPVKIVTNAPPTIAQQMAEAEMPPAGEASLDAAMAALGTA
jgi:hypothetical protein